MGAWSYDQKQCDKETVFQKWENLVIQVDNLSLIVQFILNLDLYHVLINEHYEI